MSVGRAAHPHHLKNWAIPIVALMAFVAAGCSSSPSPGSSGSVVVPRGGYANDKSDPTTMQWFKTHSAIVSSLGTLQSLGDLTQPDYSTLSASCLSFGDSVAAAKKLPAIPNAEAQVIWTTALQQFHAAVTNCNNGAVFKNVQFLQSASTDLSEGHQTLALLIFGPSTTTTAPGA